MKSKEITYLYYPNRIIVCESLSGLGENPQTHNLYRYASIIRYNSPTNVEATKWEFVGDIKWERYASMLTDEHRTEILRFAAKIKLKNLYQIMHCKNHQARNIQIFQNIYKKEAAL